MANYSNLAATINAQIKANGNQEITGPVLNAVLTAMVTVLGDGYRLQGVAAPADNPGSPDNRVAYLASQDGTYTNFGGLVVSGEVALLLWDASWTKATLVSIDAAVTPGSDNLVTSDAVNSAISALATQYMALVPAATEGNLAEFDNAGQVRDAGLATSDLATKDGHYPDLFAGFAGNLVDTRSAGTRQGPFAFRQSGGDGVNYMRKILGRTEAFNQLVQNGNFVDTNNWFQLGVILSVSNNIGTLTETESIYGHYIYQNITAVVGHKYFVAGTISGNTGFAFAVLNDGSWDFQDYNTSGTTISKHIITANSTTFAVQYRLFGADDNTTALIRNVVVVDLTLEYGAGNEPATPDQFRALHPLGYYSPASKLINNAATGLETTGFNQWDEEAELGFLNTDGSVGTGSRMLSKNYIPIVAGKDYYLYMGSSGTPFYCIYDINKAIIGARTQGSSFTAPAGAAYMKFMAASDYPSTYNHDICINRSDASRNGEYEPYWKREIVLGLNNLACHDEDDNAVVVNGLDGVGTSQDELVVENGWGTKINKRRKRVNLGDLDWYKDTAGGNWAFYTNDLNGQIVGSSTVGVVTNNISARYTTIDVNTSYNKDKSLFVKTSGQLFIIDTAYNDADSFKTAMDGVYADVELATPKVLTLDNPIPALIEVDNLGTEKRLPEDTADNPQAPFECDSNYSVSTANLVRLLNL